MAQEGYLDVNQTKLTLFLIPGDTIYVHVASAGRCTISGKTQAVQQYCAARKERFPLDSGQAAMNAGVNAPNLVSFRQQVDTLQQVQARFLTDYRANTRCPTGLCGLRQMPFATIMP